MNHNEKRIALAKEISRRIESFPEVKAFFIGGSTSVGLADEFSDLEICCVWEIVSDKHRKEIIQKLNGELFIPFQKSDGIATVEDNMHIDNFQVDLWHMSICETEKIIKSVVLEYDTHLSNQNLLYTIKNSIILFDKNHVVRNWKENVSVYPKQLAKNIIEKNIAVFSDRNYEIAIQRKDYAIFYGIVSAYQKRILVVLSALNEIYFPTYKRMEKRFSKMSLKPENLNERFGLHYKDEPYKAWRDLLLIIKDVLSLVQDKHPLIDISEVLIELDRKRKTEI